MICLCDLNYVNMCMMVYLHVLYQLYWNWHHAFSYALGHPRAIGVSAWGGLKRIVSEG